MTDRRLYVMTVGCNCYSAGWAAHDDVTISSRPVTSLCTQSSFFVLCGTACSDVAVNIGHDTDTVMLSSHCISHTSAAVQAVSTHSNASAQCSQHTHAPGSNSDVITTMPRHHMRQQSVRTSYGPQSLDAWLVRGVAWAVAGSVNMWVK